MKNILILLITMLLGSSLFAQNRMVYDSTFGVNGIATYAGYSWGKDAALLNQPNDRILSIGAKKLNDFDSDIQIVRQMPNGALDTTFNHTGRVVTTNPYSRYFKITDASLQPDGKILMAGVGGTGAVYKNTGIVSRYNQDGSLDTLFGNHGWIVHHLDSVSVYDVFISVLPDGKILGAYKIAGVANYAVPKLFRWDANGQPDPTFGVNGVVELPVGTLSTVAQMDVAADGSVFLLGEGFNFIPINTLLVKTTPEGSIIGIYPVSDMIPNGFDPPLFSRMILQPDGKVILTGGLGFGNSVVLRLTANGTLDPTFSHDGIFNETMNKGFLYGLGKVVLTPDGKIMVLSDLYFSILGFNQNGSLDFNFNGNGEFTPPAIGAPSHVGNSNRPFGIAVQSDGKLLQGVIDDGVFYMRRFVTPTCSE